MWLAATKSMERNDFMQAWLAAGLRRFYPSSAAEDARPLALAVARGERCSLQVVFRTGAQERAVRAAAQAPEPLATTVRRVGYVPMPHRSTDTPLDDTEGGDHLPGLVPDPLFPEDTLHAGPHETNAFWITLHIPPDARPGQYPLAITLAAGGEEPATLTAQNTVHGAALAPRRDFAVTHWLYADALCDWYHVELYQEAFWPVVDPYLANLVAHGQDTIYVPLLTPPIDGVKRPTQLLGVSRDGDAYHFDWSLVRRWVEAARAQGLSRFEWTHLFTQWGAQHAPRVYAGHGETASLLWPPDTGATSDVYRNFLGQLLPAFERFLHAEDLLDRSFFHLSDEPHGAAHLASYRAARELLRELAPWMRVMDALTELDFARTGLTDIPIPLLTTAPAFVEAGFPAWAYFCCVPRGRYLNRFLDTPLAKIRMAGWLLYRNRARGFLHWGYNYWYKRQTTQLIDPYLVSDALAWPGWSYGDPFVVYPGAHGPVDSLRWEVFAESLQDYALLQAAGIPADDAMLGDIQDYATFPRDASWIAGRRQRVLAQLDRQG
jgi:hypothetical protein